MTEKKICDEKICDEKKAYLPMIKAPICRMSTISAIFKGFVASIVAGITVISYSTKVFMYFVYKLK